jgi:23S rRNA (cytidine1920-2'-O)/16S rRNA (cytidine1409-2'-O)-methyltransferase
LEYKLNPNRISSDTQLSSQFVSRAGLKLSHSLKIFSKNHRLSVKNLVCADFGCNLGGFTDCLLQHDALKIYSVDTAKNCLEWNLRNNSKIKVIEKTNAMHVQLPEKVDLIVSDVAWTKQEKILPNIKLNLKNSGYVITLIKPHYEARREELHKGKVMEACLPDILNRMGLVFKENNFQVIEIIKSPITGKSGKNTEYLALLRLS